ncbi:MFS transporter [Agaribacterium haliotis]|uniref:MFS transporter n=1 Tax=Agaribacterium haliotis TaxID=2013869 RepID=UPI001EFDFD3F|nr:MFS transporter [Agaribacterium haliotis]
MPWWRLSALYFLYFAVIGALTPYWGLYLQSLNFSSESIGFIAATPLLVRIFAPNLWAFFADRSARRVKVLRIGCCLAALAFSPLLIIKQAWSVALTMAIYAIFWNAILAQAESLTLSFLAERFRSYGRIRLWGSVGFIALVLLLGWAFTYISLSFLPAIVSVLLLLLALISFSIPASAQQHTCTSDAQAFWSQLLKPELAVFFLCCTLLHASHGPYYVFFSIFLEQHGYSRLSIGFFWTLGVIAEIVLFAYTSRFIRRYSLYSLLLFSLILTSLRWLALPYAAHCSAALFVVQLLHAFSFAACHCVAVEFCRRFFGEQRQSRAQAFYSSVSFGLGGSIGAAASGLLWAHSASACFIFVAILAALAAFLCFRYLRVLLS